MNSMEQLNHIRAVGGKVTTTGLPDDVVARFLEHDDALGDAIGEAHSALTRLETDFGDLVNLDEAEQIETIQHAFVNFYPDEAINPYVSLAAAGPWIITTKGRVLHDSGGYGMLGLGHAPKPVLSAMNYPHVMANIMTANFSQLKLSKALKREIGQRRGGCPFQAFLCINSGSEAVTVGARISDVNAKRMTDPDGRYAGRPIKILALSGGFHGRTNRPARFSDSSRTTYRNYLASFRDRDNLVTIEPNNMDALREAFSRAERDNFFIESLFIEPVMGEGDPGQAVTPEFYKLARKLTNEHGSLLLVDSIQAGLRTQGVLSIVDYPGFEQCQAPDMETYSKALNGGQYPLSVLAMTERAANLYRKGIYGNTMTANPRAMDVGCAVLNAITPELRANIRERGVEFLDKLKALAKELDGAITRVQGTGLLFSCELNSHYRCYGKDSIEEYLRVRGVGVIHGGKNSLRYTPHFAITSPEVDLVVAATRDALVNGPRIADRKPKDVPETVSSL